MTTRRLSAPQRQGQPSEGRTDSAGPGPSRQHTRGPCHRSAEAPEARCPGACQESLHHPSVPLSSRGWLRAGSRSRLQFQPGCPMHQRPPVGGDRYRQRLHCDSIVQEGHRLQPPQHAQCPSSPWTLTPWPLPLSAQPRGPLSRVALAALCWLPPCPKSIHSIVFLQSF